MTIQRAPVSWGPAHAGRSGLRPPAVDQRDQARQHAVERLLILDTPPEERFDRLTRLAQKVFSVPIATITLIDADRVWRKSSAGMAMPESPRSMSFCSTAVSLGQLLIVEDARQDRRFASLPPVQAQPGIQFYAGYPLRDTSGIAVGTFCLFDFVPRTLDGRQMDLLAELAGWAQQELTNSADTQRAREVQQQLLPQREPELAGYEIAALCLPAQMVGGDFYDYARFGDGFGFCVADVMGKGVGAAIITATVRAAMRAAASRISRGPGRPPALSASVLASTSQAIQRDLDATGALVTAFVGHADAG